MLVHNFCLIIDKLPGRLIFPNSTSHSSTHTQLGMCLTSLMPLQATLSIAFLFLKPKNLLSPLQNLTCSSFWLCWQLSACNILPWTFIKQPCCLFFSHWISLWGCEFFFFLYPLCVEIPQICILSITNTNTFITNTILGISSTPMALPISADKSCISIWSPGLCLDLQTWISPVYLHLTLHVPQAQKWSSDVLRASYLDSDP